MSTDSSIPSSDVLMKDTPDSSEEEMALVDHQEHVHEMISESTKGYSVETLPSLSAESSDLRKVLDQEMKALAPAPKELQDFLPPEDDEAEESSQVVTEADEARLDGHIEDELLDKDSSAPRVPSLGLDALGDSQTPQPVSLTPEPKNFDQLGADETHALGMDESHPNLSVLPILPADLDLIAHSPPTQVSLPKNQTLSELEDVVHESIEEELSPVPRVISSLPHQRKLPEKSCRKLEAFLNSLETARGSNVLIVIKGHPDPDSLGSASALQYCYREFEIQSAILYFDEISHPENRALVKVIEMEMTLYDEHFDFSGFDYLSFVDSQDATINGYDMTTLPPILSFIDHHKETGKVQADFIDIREDLGATSTIFAEYIEYVPEFSLQKSLATHAYIATALMHGIRTDTDDLMLASAQDFHAAGYLRQFIDRDLLRMVSKQSVTARTMEIITKGLNNKIIKGTFLLAGVGFVREEDRDGIAQTADFLIRHEGVETAVVFGIVNDKYVDGSLRTSSATVDPDRWLKELFGNDESGRPFGGGRRNKGGFRVPLGLLGRSPNRKALWQLGEQTIHDIIFEKIGEKDNGVDGNSSKG